VREALLQRAEAGTAGERAEKTQEAIRAVHAAKRAAFEERLGAAKPPGPGRAVRLPTLLEAFEEAERGPRRPGKHVQHGPEEFAERYANGHSSSEPVAERKAVEAAVDELLECRGPGPPPRVETAVLQAAIDKLQKGKAAGPLGGVNEKREGPPPSGPNCKKGRPATERVIIDATLGGINDDDLLRSIEPGSAIACHTAAGSSTLSRTERHATQQEQVMRPRRRHHLGSPEPGSEELRPQQDHCRKFRAWNCETERSTDNGGDTLQRSAEGGCRGADVV